LRALSGALPRRRLTSSTDACSGSIGTKPGTRSNDRRQRWGRHGPEHKRFPCGQPGAFLGLLDLPGCMHGGCDRPASAPTGTELSRSVDRFGITTTGTEPAFAALMTDQWRAKQVAAGVLDYVRSNPSAVDNVWGIRQSCLDDPDMDLSLVEHALQRLADDGFMACRDAPLMLGGKVWYAVQAAR
jgi:hypothetical protein